MKRHIILLMVVAAMLTGCKKDSDTKDSRVIVTDEMVKDIGPTRVEISGTYSYQEDLDAIYVLVGEGSDMTGASAFESALNGKSFTAEVTGLKEDTKYYYRYRFVGVGMEQESEPVKSFTTMKDPYNGHEYVDLGLPSGLLWATCNVGADSPEDYGDYYAWGETTTKDTCNLSNYKWCNGSYDNMTKYCTSENFGTVDDKTVLEPADDAAHVNWGSDWRMPTSEELQELYDECTCTLTTLNGVNGCMIANKDDDSKFIFLPAAGYNDNGSLKNAGSYGYYWSGSLDIYFPYSACYLEFYYGVYMTGTYRSCGLSVRPVIDPRK